jgi:CelD/BcsL family acetyltransferase involved in cellulose biosynthesis
MAREAVLMPVRGPRWSSFVARHPAALPFHHPSWTETIADCYGFRGFALTVVDGTGEIVAGVPVIEVPHRRAPLRWVSLPFTDRVPVLTADGRVPTDLLDEARRAFRVGRLEVRAEVPGAEPAGTFLTHHLRLDRPEAEILAACHANQVRRNIRKARRAGVTVRHGTTEADLTGVFYRLHARTRRRLGVPVQPLRYFRTLWRHVLEPGLGTVLIADLGGAPVAAAVFLAAGPTCVYKYGASDERRWPARPNHLLFWEAICWAAGRGCRTFDFGRTDIGQNGLREFKARWGGVERTLGYSVLTDPATTHRARKGLPGPVRAALRHGPTLLPRMLGELTYRRYA